MKIHLVFGTLTILLLVLVLSERRKTAFGYESVVAMAEEMAREGYLSAVPALPSALRELTYDEVRDIRWKNERTLWPSTITSLLDEPVHFTGTPRAGVGCL